MKGKFGRVASFEEIKMDKIGLPMLISYAYAEGIQMAGNNGIPMAELLTRQRMMYGFIEGWLSPYISKEEEYWARSKDYKRMLTVELARMPQNHSTFIETLERWNRLLMLEQAKNNLLLTKTVAARI